MDELFSYLDKSGEELIGQYLKDASKDRAILVITHTDELSLYADRFWTVIKEDNVSRMEA
jgi:ABC-type transport system involved in cytochrome bd biosynthesis fused ATPase/permease subunit